MKNSLAALDGKSATTLLAALSDVTLLLDRQGVILDASVGNDDLATLNTRAWIGRPWRDTVTTESVDKVEALLRPRGQGGNRWRQINHPLAGRADVPVLYRTHPVGKEGLLVATGRDLRATAELQQRLLEAQQALEEDYARLRQIDTRYRLLFQTTSEAVLVADAETGVVSEANPAAARLLSSPEKKLIGRRVHELLAGAPGRSLQGVLDSVRAIGRADETRIATGRGQSRRELLVSGSIFRQEGVAYVLLRLLPAEPLPAASGETANRSLATLLDRLPDAFVVTDPAGHILAANNAFLELAQLGTFEQVRGESLDRWLGRSAVDLRVLLSNLQQHGVVRSFATTLSGEFGANAEVDVSAVAALNAETPSLGFIVRDARRPGAREGRRLAPVPAPVEQLTELIGRVSLKDLVRESTDMIERLCIEAALELTGDNRASAAEMLGLSRQSLYIKLRRHNLGDLDPGNDA